MLSFCSFVQLEDLEYVMLSVYHFGLLYLKLDERFHVGDEFIHGGLAYSEHPHMEARVTRLPSRQ